jgi:hypothetical protein
MKKHESKTECRERTFGEANQERGTSLSPVAIRFLEAAVDIQQNPDATDKAYMARQLVQCTLPPSLASNI